MTEPIPADRNHIHFGGGQTETTLDLPPGRHTLQLAFGDADHRLFQRLVMSERIEITVLGPKRRARSHNGHGVKTLAPNMNAIREDSVQLPWKSRSPHAAVRVLSS